MKRWCALSLACLLVAPAALAGVTTYQVTGPVLDVKDGMIVVQKGDEKWEIARGKDIKVKGDIKVGAKVTVMYTMSAAGIEAKSK